MLMFGQISYFFGPRQPIIRKVNIHKSHLAVRSHSMAMGNLNKSKETTQMATKALKSAP